jgi:hypothetical protein
MAMAVWHHLSQPTEALMKKASKTALIAMVAGLAACSDGPVAPQNEAPAGEPVNGGGSMQALTGSDTVRFSITIDPSRQTIYYLGAGNSLVFPAHSLCDPYRSSYGAGEWDKPCTVATSPATIGVKAWLDSDGHTRVDFSMHVRFVPSNNPAQWVNLTFADLQASLDPTFNINYCQSINGSCVDEAKTDPTLLTVHNPITGKITRRIKHFSGYNVAVGLDGSESDNPGSSASVAPASGASFSVASSQFHVPSSISHSSTSKLMSHFQRPQVDLILSRVEFLRRFSGYMLASG